jgi:hypothetical protein
LRFMRLEMKELPEDMVSMSESSHG